MSIKVLFALALLAFPTSLAPTDFTPDPVFDGIMCDSDIECEEATGYPYDTAMLGDDAPTYPRLVGIGCEGTIGAPIYAFEEDHFPKCREIREMDWNWQSRFR